MLNSNKAIRANKKYLGQSCAICKREIELGDFIIICPNCQSVNHDSCWKSQGGCSNISCFSLSNNKVSSSNYNNNYQNQFDSSGMSNQLTSMPRQSQNTSWQQPNMPRQPQNTSWQQSNMPRQSQNTSWQQSNMSRQPLNGQSYNSFPEETASMPNPQQMMPSNNFNQPNKSSSSAFQPNKPSSTTFRPNKYSGSVFQPNNANVTNMVSCKWCKEPIKRGTTTCPHCGKNQKGESNHNSSIFSDNYNEPIPKGVWIVLLFRTDIVGIAMIINYLIKKQFGNAIKIFVGSIIIIAIKVILYIYLTRG